MFAFFPVLMTLGQQEGPSDPPSPDPLRELVIHVDLSPEKAAALAAQAAAAAAIPLALGGQGEVAASTSSGPPPAPNPFAGLSAASAATFAFMAPTRVDAKKLSPHVSLDTSDSEGIGEQYIYNKFYAK